MIKAVIFDIDNTLYSFTEGNRRGLDAVAGYMNAHFGWSAKRFEEEHRTVQYEIYERLNYNGSCRSRLLRYQEMLERASLPLQGHALAMYELYWNTLLDSIHPFEGAADTMRALKEHGCRIGIGTDMTAFMQLKKLDRLGLLPFVDFMVSSEEVGVEKPSPAIFDMICKKAEASPQECLFIGDHLQKDYLGAAACGFHALWFCPEERELTVEEKKADRIRNLREVLKSL